MQVARRAAAVQRDPVIGWQFDQIAAAPALAEEEDGADLVLVSARTLMQVDRAGTHMLARTMIDVADEALVVTTPRHERAHAANVLAAARRLPCTRGAAYAATRAVLVVTDWESDAHAD